MILDSTLTLLAVLAGAVSANQPEAHVNYKSYNSEGNTTKPAPFRKALNSTTDVTILAAPPQTFVHEISGISIYNKDTASATVLVKTTDGTTQFIVERVTLATLESLHYEQGGGWYVLAANGAIKNGGGVSGPTSTTNTAIARWNGTDGTVLANSGCTIDASDNMTVAGTLTATGAFTASNGITVASGKTIAMSGAAAQMILSGGATISLTHAGDTTAGFGSVAAGTWAYYQASVERMRFSDTLDVRTGGSTTISTGVGSVKMSTANAATNTTWVPLRYNGSVVYVPGWLTNAP